MASKGLIEGWRAEIDDKTIMKDYYIFLSKYAKAKYNVNHVGDKKEEGEYNFKLFSKLLDRFIEKQEAKYDLKRGKICKEELDAIMKDSDSEELETEPPELIDSK